MKEIDDLESDIMYINGLISSGPPLEDQCVSVSFF
jgi:hypothetical protein